MAGKVVLSSSDVEKMLESEESYRAVASKLKKHHSWVSRRVAEARRGEDREFEIFFEEEDLPQLELHPVKHLVPEDHLQVGQSDFENAETGKTVRSWKIYRKDEQARLRRLNLAFSSLLERLPAVAPVPAPQMISEDLCNLYTITDYHLGMYSPEFYGGEDWGLDKAKEVLMNGFRKMLAMSPCAHTGIISQLGDFLHSDSLLPVTPTSGHVLDQEATLEQMIDAAMDLIEEMITLALQKHEQVYVILAEGNHDMASSAWLRKAFARIFRDNPRVVVDTTPTPFYAFEWGCTSLFFHHGHMKKKASLPLLFASRFHEIWGRTTKRYGHSGHYHHLDVKEGDGGFTMTQHQTLAPKDGYSARHGYDAERSINFTTYSRVGGQVLNGRVPREMI